MAMFNNQRVNFHRGKDWENHCVICEFKEWILSRARYGVMTAKKDQEMRLKRFKLNSPPVFDGWKWAWGLEIWQRSWDLNLVCYDVSFRDTKRLKMTMFEGTRDDSHQWCNFWMCTIFKQTHMLLREMYFLHVFILEAKLWSYFSRNETIFGIQHDPADLSNTWDKSNKIGSLRYNRPGFWVSPIMTSSLQKWW